MLLVSVLCTSKCGITKTVKTFHSLDCGLVLVNRTCGDRLGATNVVDLHGSSQCLPRLFTANIKFHYPARTFNLKEHGNEFSGFEHVFDCVQRVQSLKRITLRSSG